MTDDGDRYEEINIKPVDDDVDVDGVSVVDRIAAALAFIVAVVAMVVCCYATRGTMWGGP